MGSRAVTGKRAPAAERLARNSVDGPGDCRLWIGALNNNGYGQIGNDRKVVLAHRLAYELKTGPIPDGMQVLHKCDTPSCINPEHHFLGDVKANMEDMRAKGRAARGERVAGSKLKSGDIMEINSSKLKHHELAAMYGVSRSAITMIRQGKRWSHITAESA